MLLPVSRPAEEAVPLVMHLAIAGPLPLLLAACLAAVRVLLFQLPAVLTRMRHLEPRRLVLCFQTFITEPAFALVFSGPEDRVAFVFESKAATCHLRPANHPGGSGDGIRGQRPIRVKVRVSVFCHSYLFRCGHKIQRATAKRMSVGTTDNAIVILAGHPGSKAAR